MATYCPKCNYKLRLRDYKPECPQCGINLVYYGMEERLRAEADKAEHEFALSAPKVDRIKSSTIGSTFTKVRLGLYFLPILAMLVPMGAYSLTLPFYEKATTLNLVSIVQLVGSFDFGALMAMIKSELFGTEFLMIAISLISLLLVLVLALVETGLLVLSCSPKGLVRNFTLNFICIALVITSAITYNLAATRLSAAFPSIATASINWWGPFAILACFLVLVGTNIIQKTKGIEVKYRDVSEFLMPYDERPSVIAAKAEKEAAIKLAEELKEQTERELEVKIAAARAVDAVEDALEL
ncbi:MAG: hypothetical protein LBS36_00315 [Oscillospiraceae bacterium]|nr:hypothetical protein [Oscillospiraceae bacterium]